MYNELLEIKYETGISFAKVNTKQWEIYYDTFFDDYIIINAIANNYIYIFDFQACYFTLSLQSKPG